MPGINLKVYTGKLFVRFLIGKFGDIIEAKKAIFLSVKNIERKEEKIMKKMGKNFLRTVSFACALVMAITLADIGTHVQAQAKSTEKKAAVLYFSATGTTKTAAKRIGKKTKGTVIEIKAADPYTDADLDYGDDSSRVTKEHESASSPADSSVRPKISNMKAIKKAVKNAEVVYIGYPIWWGEAPHIVYTLVENVNLKGKTVVPFCTSISSGIGNSGTHLKANAKISAKTNWLEGRNFYSAPSQKTVNQWINGLKY